MTDGGAATEARSQQIHPLSPVIGLCNLRHFVSAQCQQIWKHYVKKSCGKMSYKFT